MISNLELWLLRTRRRLTCVVACGLLSFPNAASQSGAAPPHPAAVAMDHPAGYWQLADTSGTIARDASGQGLDGTYVGNVVLGVPGARVGDSSIAASLDGHSGYVALSDPSILQSPTLAVEAWVKSWGSEPQDQQVVRKRLYGYSLSLAAGPGLPTFWVYTGSLDTAAQTI